jgi:hypothetical protein
MRFFNVALLSAAGLFGLGNALGKAIVTNHCSVPIYLVSVSGTSGPQHTINPGQTYSEPYSGPHGVAIKITRVPGNDVPELDFAYTLAIPGIYYDLSTVHGNPFPGSSPFIRPSDTSCPGAGLASGTQYCSNDNTDLILDLSCVHGTYGYSEDGNQRYEDQSLKPNYLL